MDLQKFTEPAKELITNYPIPAILSGGLIVTGTVVWLRRRIQDFEEGRSLAKKRLRRQREREKVLEELEKKFSLTSSDSRAIVDLPFDTLQKKLATRHLSARQVLEAFVAKAVKVTREFNCVTEFVPQAWAWADELDLMDEVKGPLHGIPVCIKENQDIVGMDSTAGYSIALYKPLTKNEPIVQQLLDAGAIPFCKTNVPQTLFSYCSTNPIYGTTVNHLNKLLSPGGSSSGGACLVGAFGAPFGTGTDVGGSVRIPAHFSGISTLKPTEGRICGKGVSERTSTMAGLSVNGIMANRAMTVASVYKILIGNSPNQHYDPLIVPIPWREEIFRSKLGLKIGYLTSLPFFPSIGDTPGVVLEAKGTLEKLGHVLLPFDFPDSWLICDVYATLAYADGRWGNYSRLKNDQVSDAGRKFFRKKSLLSKFSVLVKYLIGPKSSRDLEGNSEAEDSKGLWIYLEKQKRIKYDILGRMQRQNLDLILMPVFPFPAPRLGDPEKLINGIVWTCPFNLCNFPAGVVPFGIESGQNVEAYDDQGDHYLKLAKEATRHAKGMPIGVQIVGKPFNEELILRILVELDEFKLGHSYNP